MKKPKRYLFYQLFACLLVILQSCEKTEAPYPDITISAPADGSYYAYGDTILLQFSASPATSVNYAILQEDQIISVNSQRVYYENGNYEVEFYLNDKYLAESMYTIRVQAENKGSISSAFTDIYYSELSLQIKGYASLGPTELGRVDSSGSFSALALSSNFNFLAVNSPGGYVALASQRDAAFSAFNFNSLWLAFSLPRPQPNGFDQYTEILSHESKIIALQADGKIVKVDENGQINRSINVTGNEVPRTACLIGDRLAVVTQALGNPQKHLRIYNSLLVEEQNFILGTGNYKICPYANGEVGIFRNLQGNTEFLIYKQPNNTLTSIFSLIGEQVSDCEAINSGHVVFTTNQATYTFQQNVQQSPLEVLNFAVSDIEVSAVNQQVVLLHQGFIQSLDASGTLRYLAPAAQNAFDFEIYYNK